MGRADLASEQEIDRLEISEVGRPHWGPLPMPGHAHVLRRAGRQGQGLSLPTHTPDVLGLTLREPYGVVGAIIPWNAPGPNFVMDVGPAIAAGNTIVIKPAEDAPLTRWPWPGSRRGRHPARRGQRRHRLRRGGGRGDPGAPRHLRMSFTGSPATGSAVMAACARNHTPLHLELGGKSPQVLLDDADLDAAVPQLTRGITLNTGQICAVAGSWSTGRSTPRSRRLAEAFAKVRVGPGTETSTWDRSSAPSSTTGC